MFAIISAILSALTGGVAQELAGAYKAQQEAKTDEERIAADERIKRLQSIADVQKAEAGNPINTLVRASFAVPIAAYFGKIFVVDKILNWGSTDPLSPELWQVALVVIGFYFLHDTATGIARIVKR